MSRKTDPEELRDWLAGQALAGMLSNPYLAGEWHRKHRAKTEPRVMSQVYGPLAYRIAPQEAPVDEQEAAA